MFNCQPDHIVTNCYTLTYARKQHSAEADFARAVRLDPSNAEAHTGLGYLWAQRGKNAEAQRAASQALLHGAGDYFVLHNVACIYARLAQMDKDRAAEHEDLALVLLQRGVELWRRGGTGPSAIELMKWEPAFLPSLKARPEFQKLIKS